MRKATYISIAPLLKKIMLFSVLALCGLLLSSLTRIYDWPLYRYVIIRLTAIAIGAPALCGLMIVVDMVTPGDWMEEIINDPKASAAIMCAIVLVIGAILCWA